MLAKKIIEMIEKARLNQEEFVLQKIKAEVAKAKSGSLGGVKKVGKTEFENTPLHSAAVKGFTKVLTYLLEEVENKPNVNAVIAGNQTALDYAILFEKVEAAEYLATKTTYFPQDKVDGYTALHSSVICGLFNVVKKIIAQDRGVINIRSNLNVTALLLAAENARVEILEYLLQEGADFTIADNQGATPFGMALSQLKSQVFSGLSLYFNDDSLFSHNLLGKSVSPFEVLLSTGSKASKIPSLNILFSIGAGLDIHKIPDEILTMFKVDKSTSGPFLLYVREILEDGTTKGRLIHQIEHFQRYISAPEKWRFELKQIARATMAPSVSNLAHVVQIRNLLPPESFEFPQAAAAVSANLATETKENAIQRIKTMEPHLYDLHCKVGSYSFELANQQFFINFQLILNEKNLELEPILILYMKALERMIELSGHAQAARQVDSFNRVCLHFSDTFAFIWIALLAPQSYNYKYKTLLTIEQSLIQILKHHKHTLSKVHIGLYNAMVDAKAMSAAGIASVHLTEGNHTLAFSYAMDSLYYTRLLIKHDNFALQKQAHLNKGEALCILSEVDFAAGWIGKSYQNLNEAVHLIKNSGLRSHMLSFTIERVIDSIQVRVGYEKAIFLLGDTLIYLNQLKALLATMESELSAFLRDKEHVEKYIDMFSEKLDQFQSKFFQQRSQEIMPIFYEKMHVVVDNKEKSIKFSFLEDVEQYIHSGNRRALKKFLKSNKEIQCSDEPHTFTLQRSFIFSSMYKACLERLQFILFKLEKPKEIKKNYSATPDAKAMVKINENLEDLQITPKIKIKTKGVADGRDVLVEEDLHEENYGFSLKDGFSRAIPLFGSRVEENTLFVRILENKAFTPFFNLAKGPDADKLYPIHNIAEKGLNQQGAKLGTDKKEQRAYVRLKVLGADVKKQRAQGWVIEENTSSDGKRRMLFEIGEITDKKKEKRSKRFAK